MRLYRYVGPKRIAERVGAGAKPAGVPVRSADDVRAWARKTRQESFAGVVIATFVVDESGGLLVADRRSEHVACAGGRAVLSAGEIEFVLGRSIEVAWVSNQSTGHCPEPESWPAVVEALGRAGLVAPDGFAPACEFRRCLGCDNLTLIKDGLFECGACGRETPAASNVQEQRPT